MKSIRHTSTPLVRLDHASTSEAYGSPEIENSNSHIGLIMQVKLRADQFIKIDGRYFYLCEAKKSIARTQVAIAKSLQSQKVNGVVGATHDGELVSFYWIAQLTKEEAAQGTLLTEDPIQKIHADDVVRLGESVRGIAAELSDDSQSNYDSESQDVQSIEPSVMEIIRSVSKSGMKIVRESDGQMIECPTPKLNQLPTIPINNVDQLLECQGTVTGKIGERTHVLDEGEMIFEYDGALEVGQFVVISGYLTKKSVHITSIDGEYTVTPVQQLLPGFSR